MTRALPRHAITFFALASWLAMPAAARETPTNLSQLPDYVQAYGAFDAVVIGDIDPSRVSPRCAITFSGP